MAAPAGEDDSICPSLLLPEAVLAVEVAGVGWVITTMLDLDRWGHRHLDVGTLVVAVAVAVPGVVVATMTTIEGCLEAEEDECQAIPHWDGEEEEVVADQEEKVAVVDHRHHRGDRTLN